MARRNVQQQRRRRRNNGGGGSVPPPPAPAPAPAPPPAPSLNPPSITPYDFSAPATYSGPPSAPPRGVQEGEGIPNFRGGANGTNIPSFTLPNWTNVLQHYKPPAQSLPLTGYGLQARNQIESALSSDLAGYGAEYSQIAPQYNLQNARISTNEGLDRQHQAESLADRGIFLSGVTNDQFNQLAGQYNRQYQDLISQAQQQATDVTQGISGSVGDYYASLADLYNQIASTEYQNPYSPVPQYPAGGGSSGGGGGGNSGGGGGSNGGGGNSGGGGNGGGSKNGGKGSGKTASGRRRRN